MLEIFVSRLTKPLLCLSFTALVGLLSSCTTSRPEAPLLQPLNGSALAASTARIASLLPADVVLLGEQHDAREHQHIEQQVIAILAAQNQLAAVAIEMADSGTSTASLKPSATELQAQSALKWSQNAWPWEAYGPAVMTAVRAGVPVLGANLPRPKMSGSMTDSQLDVQLPGPALKAQQQLIRIGHCNLLPESQITPMTRIQIAKDITMAYTLSQAAVPGKIVVLLAGNGHVDRLLGVPQHLPAALKVKAVRLHAGNSGDSGDTSEISEKASFDVAWDTPALPETDYCAQLRNQFAVPPQVQLPLDALK